MNKKINILTNEEILNFKFLLDSLQLVLVEKDTNCPSFIDTFLRLYKEFLNIFSEVVFFSINLFLISFLFVIFLIVFAFSIFVIFLFILKIYDKFSKYYFREKSLVVRNSNIAVGYYADGPNLPNPNNNNIFNNLKKSLKEIARGMGEFVKENPVKVIVIGATLIILTGLGIKYYLVFQSTESAKASGNIVSFICKDLYKKCYDNFILKELESSQYNFSSKFNKNLSNVYIQIDKIYGKKRTFSINDYFMDLDTKNKGLWSRINNQYANEIYYDVEKKTLNIQKKKIFEEGFIFFEIPSKENQEILLLILKSNDLKTTSLYDFSFLKQNFLSNSEKIKEINNRIIFLNCLFDIKIKQDTEILSVLINQLYQNPFEVKKHLSIEQKIEDLLFFIDQFKELHYSLYNQKSRLQIKELPLRFEILKNLMPLMGLDSADKFLKHPISQNIFLSLNDQNYNLNYKRFINKNYDDFFKTYFEEVNLMISEIKSSFLEIKEVSSQMDFVYNSLIEDLKKIKGKDLSLMLDKEKKIKIFFDEKTVLLKKEDFFKKGLNFRILSFQHNLSILEHTSSQISTFSFLEYFKTYTFDQRLDMDVRINSLKNQFHLKKMAPGNALFPTTRSPISTNTQTSFSKYDIFFSKIENYWYPSSSIFKFDNADKIKELNYSNMKLFEDFQQYLRRTRGIENKRFLKFFFTSSKGLIFYENVLPGSKPNSALDLQKIILFNNCQLLSDVNYFIDLHFNYYDINVKSSEKQRLSFDFFKERVCAYENRLISLYNTMHNNCVINNDAKLINTNLSKLKNSLTDKNIIALFSERDLETAMNLLEMIDKQIPELEKERIEFIKKELPAFNEQLKKCFKNLRNDLLILEQYKDGLDSYLPVYNVLKEIPVSKLKLIRDEYPEEFANFINNEGSLLLKEDFFKITGIQQDLDKFKKDVRQLIILSWLDQYYMVFHNFTKFDIEYKLNVLEKEILQCISKGK
jgi:hypothetical protein